MNGMTPQPLLLLLRDCADVLLWVPSLVECCACDVGII